MRNNVNSNIFWYGDMFLPVWTKNENFPKFIYDIQYMKNCEGMTSSKLWGDDIINSLIRIFISSGQEMFSEKIWNVNMSYLPNFLPDFHNFCTIL